MEGIKYSVTAVILNDKNEVLAVSRKDDHNDFSLPGGWVDTKDDSLEMAICREIKEETGLNVKPTNLLQVLSMNRGGNMSYSYYVKDYEGEIETDEPHIVKWTDFEEIKNGSFGYWNTLVEMSVNNFGFIK
jgi:ADP-ribose pyrophosphatase YjhB (NUDIX family)